MDKRLLNHSFFWNQSSIAAHWLVTIVCSIGILTMLVSGCQGKKVEQSDDELKVVATTSIIGDVVEQVGGEWVSVDILIPANADPHDYQPRPQDVVRLTEAETIFSNGASLESFLPALLGASNSVNKLVELSEGITLIQVPGDDGVKIDPHTWMDPRNVLIWVDHITEVLTSIMPAQTSYFEANANYYKDHLLELDVWIREQVSQIPDENRKLISDHAVLGYFADAYGLTIEGTISGSFSSEASPSIQELVGLEKKINSRQIKAIFISEAASRSLAEQIASDTGITVVWIYHASLTEAGGPAGSYLDFMRYNVGAMVGALK